MPSCICQIHRMYNNLNVNYELWVIMCQCRFTHWNKYIILVLNVDSEGRCACVQIEVICKLCNFLNFFLCTWNCSKKKVSLKNSLGNAIWKPTCIQKKKKKSPWKCGEMYWSKRLLKWVESERLNSKGTAHKHCAIVNKLSSPGYRSTILILLYIQIQLIK